MRHSLDQGEAPIASHLIYTQPGILDDSVEKERDQGIQAGYEWMDAADLVAFYTDRGWSRGMIRALKMARILNKRIEVRSLGPSMPLSLDSVGQDNLLRELKSRSGTARIFYES